MRSQLLPLFGFALLFHLACQGHAGAPWPPDGVQLCVGCDADSRVAGPDGTGGAYVVWREFRGEEYDVYLQRVTRLGEIPEGWPATGLPVATGPEYQQHYLQSPIPRF